MKWEIVKLKSNYRRKETPKYLRRSEISELERQIADIDVKISASIGAKSLFSDKLMQATADSRISKLKSKKEILVIKFRELYKIEQEYQSKK